MTKRTRNRFICQECGTKQPLGSGIIVCRKCQNIGLQEMFATEDEASEHVNDLLHNRFFADNNAIYDIAYVADPTGGDGYWIVEPAFEDHEETS